MEILLALTNISYLKLNDFWELLSLVYFTDYLHYHLDTSMTRDINSSSINSKPCKLPRVSFCLVYVCNILTKVHLETLRKNSLSTGKHHLQKIQVQQLAFSLLNMLAYSAGLGKIIH